MDDTVGDPAYCMQALSTQQRDVDRTGLLAPSKQQTPSFTYHMLLDRVASKLPIFEGFGPRTYRA
jgi:hypothetical protein